MAWVEVYGGQRSLAFELTTASKNRTWGVVSAVHHLHHYTTEDYPSWIGLI